MKRFRIQQRSAQRPTPSCLLQRSTPSKPTAYKCFIELLVTQTPPWFSFYMDSRPHRSRSANSFRAWRLITAMIAPDLPGFGFTEVPDERKYVYSFHGLASTIEAFTQALKINRCAIYVFDYGAPTGLRLAMAHPERVTAIVSQNGNAYEEGLGDAWDSIRKYWAEPTAENRDVLRKNVLTLEETRWQYTHGVANPDGVPPESYTLDTALLERSGNKDIQLDLFLDYASNLKLYPKFQEYFRKWKPPLLAIWARTIPFSFPRERRRSGKTCRTLRFSSLIPDILR